MEFNQLDAAQLENELRAEGAPLPPSLRERVLRRCAEEGSTRQRWHRRFDLRLSGAFAGLCLFYWLAMGVLDGQRTALMFPTNGGSGVVLMADAHNSSPAALEHAIKSRSRMLATLLEGSGRYGEEVNYDAHDESG